MIDKAVIFLKRPMTIAYFSSLLILLIGLALTYKVRPFTSDDSFWQTILLNGWLPFHHEIAAMGNSSIHADKLPFYQLFNAIMIPSRKVLFIESTLLAVASLTAFYWPSIYLIKRLTNKARLSFINLVPFLWVMGLGYAFISLYLDPDWRSFEISFSFVIFALTYAFWKGDLKLHSSRSILLLILITTYTGLLIYSDPYILYFALAPLALFTVIAYFPLHKISLRLTTTTLIALMGSIIISKFFSFIGTSAGITIQINYNNVSFVDFSQLGNNLAQTVQSLLVIFGADFFGLGLKASLLIPLVGFALFSIVVYSIYSVVTHLHHRASFNALWIIFIVTLLVFSMSFYALTDMNQGITTYRYLLFPVLLCVPLLSYFMTTTKNKTVAYAIGVIMITSIVLHIAGITRTPTDNKANVDNYQVITILKNLGYTKGYAGYWDANITSYLSNGAVQVLPSLCSSDKMTQWQWLINNNAFNTKATKSFYINNPNAPWPISTQNNICSGTALESQFGQPAQVLTYKQETIYLYNYDITSKL